MTIQKKTPSGRFYKLLDKIVENEKSTKQSFEDAVEAGREQGFTDTEIAMFMHDYLRDKIPKTTLGRWLKPLTTPELEESTSQSGPVDQNDDNKDTEQESTFEEPEPIVVTTSGEEEKVEQKLESVGVDLKQQRIDELEAALRKSEEQKEQFKRDSLARGEALKKSSFKVASDPDNMNEDYDEKIAIPMLVSKLRQKQASGWHFVENRMRYIS